MNWDDIRVVRAVFQNGSFAAAARQLGVNPTTVPRRLERLERTLGYRLFEAQDGARRPTPECARLLEFSEPVARQMEQIQSLGDAATTIVERRRLATTDSIAAALIAPALPAFLAHHENLAVDLLASTTNVDFSRWEADIAIRLKRPARGNFVLSRLGAFSLYLCTPLDDGDAASLVCGYPEELADTPESRFLAETGLAARLRVRTMNLLVIAELLASGQCAGILPGFLVNRLPADRQFRLEALPGTRSAWLLVQPHLRNDPPTRHVVEWLKEIVGNAL